MSASAIHDILDTETVYTVIARCFGVARNQLTAKTRLVEDLGIDSIDLLALAVDLEEEFDVVIIDRELLRIHTIGDTIVCMVAVCELLRIEHETAALPATEDASVSEMNEQTTCGDPFRTEPSTATTCAEQEHNSCWKIRRTKS